jgi:phosphoenolpyruvate-protein phosphotransferase (PTS system enzyme I)
LIESKNEKGIKSMKILKGISAASGIKAGKVCLYLTEMENSLPHYSILAKQINNELKRLDEAMEQAKKSMKEMVAVAQKQLDKDAQEIFNTHLLILNDKSLYAKVSGVITAKKVNAEHAVNDVFEEFIQKYKTKGEHFKELIHDFVDTRNRILNAFNIETGKFKCPIGEREPVIVAAKRFPPSLVLSIPKENALAFVTEEGGFTSHSTILARSYGVPIVFGIEVEKNLDCGTEVIVDGSAGKIIVEPDKKTQIYYQRKIEDIEKKKLFCEPRKALSVQTRAGSRVQLKLNINTPSEMNFLEEFPHDGIGLLRTEFLFMQRNEPPSEEEQYKMYRSILSDVAEKPVTVRLLDIGTDKMPLYFKLPSQINPDLGLRGSFAVENFSDIYLTQMKALLRANINANLRLLYPMVSDLSDLAIFRDLVTKAKRALKREKIKFNDKGIQEGIMIETPSAVMLAQELLKEVDFVNIGSNDLLQYTLAAARGNVLVEKRYHVLHPALVRLLEIVVKAGKKAKKEVCLCGEVASFEEFHSLLFSIGLRSFSVSVSKFADIKCELLHLEESAGKTMIKNFYKKKTKEEIDEYFKL